MGVVYLARDPVLEREVAIKMLTSGNLQGDQRETVRARGPRGRQARPSRHRPHLRLRGLRGEPLLRHALRRGQDATRGPEGGDPQALRGPRYRRAGGGSPPLFAPARHRPSRHQAREHHGHPRGRRVAREAHGFRDRARAQGLAHDQVRHHRRHPRLPAARVDPRFVQLARGRHLLPRRGHVRESMSGKLPFSGDTQTVLYKIVHSEPEPPGLLASLVDMETENIVLACMAKAAAARPKDGNEIGGGAARVVAAAQEPGNPALHLDRGSTRAGSAIVGRSHEIEGPGQVLPPRAGGRSAAGPRGRRTGIRQRLRCCGNWSACRRAGAPSSSTAASWRGSIRPCPIRDSARPSASIIEADPVPAPPRPSGTSCPSCAFSSPKSRRPRDGDSQSSISTPKREDRTFTLDLLARARWAVSRAAQPLVLLFEDLHLADASLEAIQYVFHRRSSSRLMIAGTYVQSGGGDGDPMSRLVKSIRGDQGTLLIQLKALDAADCRQLAMGILEKEQRSRGRRTWHSSRPPAAIPSSWPNSCGVSRSRGPVRGVHPRGPARRFAQGLALPNSLQKLMEEKVAAMAGLQSQRAAGRGDRRRLLRSVGSHPPLRPWNRGRVGDREA